MSVALLVRVAARRSRPAGGHFLLLAQKKVTKEEGLNTICLADVARDQRRLSTSVERGHTRASDEILSENGAAVGVCRPPSSVLPAEPYPGGWRRAWRAPRSAGRAARARSALRDLTCRRLSERRERSEQSELGDRAAWPSTAGKSERQRRPPGSARRHPPGHGSACSVSRTTATGPRADVRPHAACHSEKTTASACLPC